MIDLSDTGILTWLLTCVLYGTAAGTIIRFAVETRRRRKL